MNCTQIRAVVSALIIFAVFLLGGCALRIPTVSRDAAATRASSQPTESVPPTASSSAATTTLPTIPLPTDLSQPLTQEQAIAVAKHVMDRAANMFTLLSFPTFPSLVEMDESQTIPGEPDFWLVTDERFQSLAELRAYVETVYTPAYVDKYLSPYFEDKDVKEGPAYKEYEGRFYANSNLAGMGNEAEPAWDSMRLLSQDEKGFAAEVDVYLFGELNSVETYVFENSGTLWRLEDIRSQPVSEQEWAVALTRDVLAKTDEMYHLLRCCPSSLETDASQTIPGYPNFQLVTDKRCKTKPGLKAYIETVYTPAYVDAYFFDIFHDNQKESGFLEYDQRLYVDSRFNKAKKESIPAWDTLYILYREHDSLTVKINGYVNGNLRFEHTYTMKRYMGNWCLDDEYTEAI